jgi:ABC-type uncharacterized transport system permease subunit
MTDDLDNRSLRQLLDILSRDLRLLALQTVALARAEIRAATAALTWSIAMLAAGIVIMIAGILVIVSSLVLIAIALGLPPWAASVLIGLLVTAAGALTVRGCLRKLQRLHVDLRDTRQNVAETFAWLQAQALK